MAKPTYEFDSLRKLRDFLKDPGWPDGRVILRRVPGAPYGGVWPDVDKAESWLREFLLGAPL